MTLNLTELERLLTHYEEHNTFIYLEDMLFEQDGIRRNGIFTVNEEENALTSVFLYAKENELMTTGAAFQLISNGKAFVMQLLERVTEECPRVLAIKERIQHTCEGDWGYAKDSNIVSKTTNSYTIWAVRNEVKFKSENRSFLVHLIPDLKFLLEKCKSEFKN